MSKYEYLDWLNVELAHGNGVIFFGFAYLANMVAKRDTWGMRHIEM